jgi:predicted RNA-binding protein with PUA-like domain
MKYWLFKSEPKTYSIDDLAAEPDQTTCWEGVRNYQARNMLRDDVSAGDWVFFYHSVRDPGIVGLAEVVRGGYPDHYAWDKRSKYFDEKSDPENPRWFMVDIQLREKFERPLPLDELKSMAVLKEMELLRKGSRLSIQPVRKKEWNAILKRANSQYA